MKALWLLVPVAAFFVWRDAHWIYAVPLAGIVVWAVIERVSADRAGRVVDGRRD